MSRDLLPNTSGPHGTPVPGGETPTIVQEGLMNQWPAHAEYRPGTGWFTVVSAFGQTSVRPGLDRQFRPSDPSPEFIAQARLDHPDWLEHMTEPVDGQT